MHLSNNALLAIAGLFLWQVIGLSIGKLLFFVMFGLGLVAANRDQLQGFLFSAQPADYGKGLDDDWSGKPNATFICFACCMNVGTERCHILPRCEGGSDEVNNLHLLCKECHLESETLSGDVYWQWLQSKNYSNSGSFLRVWNKTKIIQSLYEQKKFDLLPPDVLVGINNFLNTQK